MKTFNIYKHPTKGFEAIKVGFSWPALFFSIIWILIKRQWGSACIWFLCFVLLWFFSSQLLSISDPLLFIVFAILWFYLWRIPANEGNKWCEKDLLKRGYEFQCSIQAHSPDAAVGHAATYTSASWEKKDTDSGNEDQDHQSYGPWQQKHEKILESRSQDIDSEDDKISIERFHARILGLRGKVTMDDVRKAYRSRMAEYHPDKVAHLGPKLRAIAEEETRAIKTAYEYFRLRYGNKG